jgi:hypothetical protein
MPGITREVVEHKLSIDTTFKPIKQKERRYTPERREVIRLEVNKLLEARFRVDLLSTLSSIAPVSLPRRSPSSRTSQSA